MAQDEDIGLCENQKEKAPFSSVMTLPAKAFTVKNQSKSLFSKVKEIINDKSRLPKAKHDQLKVIL